MNLFFLTVNFVALKLNFICKTFLLTNIYFLKNMIYNLNAFRQKVERRYIRVMRNLLKLLALVILYLIVKDDES